MQSRHCLRGKLSTPGSLICSQMLVVLMQQRASNAHIALREDSRNSDIAQADRAPARGVEGRTDGLRGSGLVLMHGCRRPRRYLQRELHPEVGLECDVDHGAQTSIGDKDVFHLDSRQLREYIELITGLYLKPKSRCETWRRSLWWWERRWSWCW